MIYFNVEIEKFKLSEKLKLKKWLNDLAKNEGFKITTLSYIFVNDEELLKINQKYLNHDTFTDIITFDNSEKDPEIEGDIFISVDRIKENANTFMVPFETELKRVMAHGLLHLCGYKDKTEAEIAEMREKEGFIWGFGLNKKDLSLKIITSLSWKSNFIF